MKNFSTQQYLAFFTFIALIAILGVQTNWLFKAAKLEEERFNYFVNKALTEAKHEIGDLASECEYMNDFLCGNMDKEGVSNKNVVKIDSILRAKLEKYDIELDYTFIVAELDAPEPGKGIFRNKCYLKCLNGMLEKDGIKIMLEFPARNQFLLAQLTGTFLLAIVSILFVMISFVFTSRMFRKERQLLQQTTDFINNMVHEFQTPLANVRLAVGLIKKRQNASDSKTSEYISVILKENLRLEKNVEEILKVSSCGNFINREGHVLVDFNELIEQSGEYFKTRIESQGGSLQFSLNAQEANVLGDPNHFRIIISNLIDNAIKYSNDSPQIMVETNDLHKKIQLRIADKGIGIERKYLDKIFDKYYRVSTGNVHNVKGFGLGLTYVKQLVEIYKGKISVSSTKGKGTLFTIVLPLHNEQDENSFS